MKVPHRRWLDAQEWELGYWTKANRSSVRSMARVVLARLGIRRFDGDDWNHWWYEKFDGYRHVPAQLSNVIELGCGPYTNVRLITKDRKISHLYCSDPLVGHYVKFRGRWLSEAWRRGGILIDDHAIELCPFATDYFDLTILINVLDHVQNASLCLDQAIRITRPGGILVVGQDLTDHEDQSNIQVRDDVGHPIRLSDSDLDATLLRECKPLLYKILPREMGRNPSAHCGTYLLVGEKLVN